ncbi:hypothetical protein ACFWQG_19385 [Rhodococcus sp. NPDC058532]|uniref:hypothetical protein n=1 Tax=Rhodococcus sp. NPDC058532 TaxID=3346540 RepID=UPI00364CB7F9
MGTPMDPSEVSAGEGDRSSTQAPGVAAPAWLSPPPPSASPRAVDAVEAEEPAPARRRWRRGVLPVTAAAVLVVGGVAAAGLALNAADRSPPGTAPSTAAAAPDELAWCAGLGAGHPADLDAADPGEAAIAGFERAYYVLRDGARAREHVAPDARVGSAEQIGRGIAEIPVGTTHCVLVKRATDGAYAVDVFERRPDGSIQHYPQTVLTGSTPDGTRITAITPREG